MKRRNFLKLGLVGIGSMALADKAWALKYYPNPSDKKWAVVYSSWCGSSRDAGIWISEGMGGIADVFDVREKPDLNRFDNIVIGASVRGFQIHPAMQKYIEENRGLIKKKVRGFWVVCGNLRKPPGPEQKEMYVDKQLAQPCRVGDIPCKIFNGRITLGLLDKEAYDMMTQMGVQDYDDLKRIDCLNFGKEILAGMS